MIVCVRTCWKQIGHWFRATHLSCGFDSFPDAEVAEHPGQQQAESYVPVRSERHVPCLSDNPIPREDIEADRQVDWQAGRQTDRPILMYMCLHIDTNMHTYTHSFIHFMYVKCMSMRVQHMHTQYKHTHLRGYILCFTNIYNVNI